MLLTLLIVFVLFCVAGEDVGWCGAPKPPMHG